jgi:AAA family ATP:ADP antiporter
VTFEEPRLSRLLDSVKPAERPAVAWAFLYFFSVLSAYYVLRPLRDTMGIVGGIKNLPWQFTATLGAMLVAVPVYSALVARYPRRHIIPVVYHFFAANLLLFLAAERMRVAEVWVARVFFVWLSVFSLFVVAVLWSFLVDTFRPDQAKRLFGVVAAGGSVGALAGPALARLLVLPFGNAGLYLASILLLQLAVLAVRRLTRWADAQAAEGGGQTVDRAVGGNAFAGFWIAIKNPYLLAIVGMLLCYSSTSTVIYTDQARIVSRALDDPAAQTALFATIDFWVSVVALTAQALVTGWFLTTFGLIAALFVVPLVTAGGFVALAASPGITALFAVQVFRRGLQYGLERPSREVLFTVVSPEAKYKAKAFIDTVVFRGGDAAAIWAYTAFRKVGPSPGIIAGVMLCICAGWLALTYYAGRRHAVAVKDLAAEAA